jgi:hypothetical protein
MRYDGNDLHEWLFLLVMGRGKWPRIFLIRDAL